MDRKNCIKLTRFSPSEGEEAEAGPFLFNPAPWTPTPTAFWLSQGPKLHLHLEQLCCLFDPSGQSCGLANSWVIDVCRAKVSNSSVKYLHLNYLDSPLNDIPVKSQNFPIIFSYLKFSLVWLTSAHLNTLLLHVIQGLEMRRKVLIFYSLSDILPDK